MSLLKINQEKCIGCSLCIKSCSTDALYIENDKAMVNDNCILCGLCVDACPLQAISLEKKSLETIDPSQYSGIWIFAEQHKGEVLPVVYELLGKGQKLAQKKGCKLTAVIFGTDIKSNIQNLVSYGAQQIIFCEDISLVENLDENYAELLAMLIEKHKPEILLFGATGFGRSLAPRVAAKVGTGLTADCTILEIDEETSLLQQTRPAFGGNLMATIICPNHRPQMATIRPGVMSSQKVTSCNEAELLFIAMPELKKSNIEILEEILSHEVNSIADSEIIVSVGRGIGSPKNMNLAKRLAELIGGTVGVTRPLVDIGWSQYKNQIGQTGSVVSPKLLITCGISGAIQHLAGINNAGTIIAINNDPEAPIFSIADYKVVGDCIEILKKLIATLEKN